MKKIAFFTIIIGIIGLTMNLTFGYGTFSFVQTIDLGNGLTAQKVDFFAYITNIRDSFTDTARMELTIIPVEWNNEGNWDALINNLKFIVDILIFAINIFMYPIRIGAYLLTNVLAILGIRVYGDAGGVQWLVTFCRILQSLQIPMIP